MKTNYKLLFGGLLGLLLFPSCVNDEILEENADEQKGLILVATQDVFNTFTEETRTQVDRWYLGNGSEGKAGVAMQWTPGDKIGAIGDNNSHFDLTYEGSEPSYSGIFRNTRWKYNYQIWSAYYPYTEGSTESNVLASIQPNQNYTGRQSISVNDLKATIDSKKTVSKGRYSAEFHQLATLLRFEINAVEIQQWLKNKNKSVSDGDRLSSFEFSCSEGSFLTGDFTYSLKPFTKELRANMNGKNKPSNVLNVNVTDVTKEEIKNGEVADVVYAIVAPVENTTLNLSFKYGQHTIHMNAITHDLVQGKVYNILLNASSLSKASVESPSEPLTPSGMSDGNEFQNGGSAF